MIRAAASFPEISTIGTPTPGWVPDPVKTTFGYAGCRLLGRNGPVGAMILERDKPSHGFSQVDLALAEDIAARAATALDKAQLYLTICEGERRKDEFLAMLGHELRNPLAAIMNAGELTALLSPNDPVLPEALSFSRILSFVQVQPFRL